MLVWWVWAGISAELSVCPSVVLVEGPSDVLVLGPPVVAGVVVPVVVCANTVENAVAPVTAEAVPLTTRNPASL